MRRVRRYVTTRQRRLKYNIENRALTAYFDGTGATSKCVLIDAEQVSGVRKVANLRGSFTINLLKTSNDNTETADNQISVRDFPPKFANQDGYNILIYIIYLPEGFDIKTQTLTLPTATKDEIPKISSVYSPSQNVLWSGMISFNSGVVNFRVPISKNMNGGDQIIILARSLGQTNYLEFHLNYTYAIAYR